jgi:hypothetical protein
MKRALTYFIVGLHLFFLCSFIFGGYLPPKKHRIAVHSVRLKTPPQQIQPKNIATAKKTTSPSTVNPRPEQQKQQKQPQSQPSRPLPNKKPTPTTAATAPQKKEAKTTTKKPAVSQKLIKELEESIAKIDEKPDNFKSEKYSAKTKSQAQAPLVLNSLQRETFVGPFTEQEITPIEIKELLVLELKNSLHLPDFGEVTMRLILRRDGSVAEVKVLKSASKKNSEYLERELPKHSFSFVADLGLKDNERNFVITFCNEI